MEEALLVGGSLVAPPRSDYTPLGGRVLPAVSFGAASTSQIFPTINISIVKVLGREGVRVLEY